VDFRREAASHFGMKWNLGTHMKSTLQEVSLSLFEENAAILQKMAVDGKDLTSVRAVNFCHVFPDKISADAFAQAANAEGFSILVDEVERETNPWDVTASKEITPSCDAITDIEKSLDRLAQSYKGRADGWGFFNV
jgi:hypothetical protein